MKQSWEIKKLGEVFDLQMGKTPSRDNSDYWGGSNVWVAISDLQDKYIGDSKEYITDQALTETKIKKVKAGTTIMSFKLSVGRAAITTKDLYTNEAIMAFNLNEGYNLIADYIYYYLKGYKWQGANKAVMGLTLNKASISQNHIAIPPIEMQEKIVAELDCLSGVIEKKREQLRELDALAQSIFYTMFGDPITNEKGWEVKKLEELCDIINGFAFPSSDFADCNPIKVIKITNVGVNEFISDDSSLPDDYNNMEGCKVYTGDIVIALTRTIISTGVKRAIVPNEYNESLVNQRVAAILANDRIVSRRFIYSFLGTDFVRQYILQKATALMQPNLSIRDLRDMPTIYPPLALQHEFADKIEAIERQKELIKQSITETETLFNARMAYYFN